MVSCRPSFTHWPAARRWCRCERGSLSFVAYRLSQTPCPHIHSERRQVAGRPGFSSVVSAVHLQPQGSTPDLLLGSSAPIRYQLQLLSDPGLALRASVF